MMPCPEPFPGWHKHRYCHRCKNTGWLPEQENKAVTDDFPDSAQIPAQESEAKGESK